MMPRPPKKQFDSTLGFPGEGPPADRAKWLVSLQPVTTRPATCKVCHEYFQDGELRLCTVAQKRRARWLHKGCIHGGLQDDFVFLPDKVTDVDAVAELSAERDRVRHLQCLDNGQSAISAALEAPTDLQPAEDGSLPCRDWFATLSWDALQELSGVTFVQVPHRFETAFTDALAPALQLIVSPDSDTSDVLAGWKALLVLPWLLLRRPADPDGADTCASLLTDRLDRYRLGDVPSLFRESVADSRCLSSNKTSGPMKSAEVAKRVKTLTRAGETGRAIRAVASWQDLPVTGAVVRRLRQLFPASDAMEDECPTPADASPGHPDREPRYIDDIRRLPRLSGPGLLGMRNEHLSLLAAASEHKDALHQVLQQLALGTAPAEVIGFLRGGRLVPLPKPDGDIRPLTLANVLRRAALKSFVRAHKEDCRVACGSLQHGVACPAGIDLLQKKLLLASALHPDSVVIALDFRAAFQMVRRGAVLRAVAAFAPWAWGTAHAWYDGVAHHVVRDSQGISHVITADRGVDQGCPLGAFLFALVLRGPAEAVLAYARSLDPAAALAFYLDDGYLVIDAMHAPQVLDKLRAEFAQVGLELNDAKVKVWARPGLSIPEALQPIRTDSLKCLGRHLSASGSGDGHPGLECLTPVGDLTVETQQLAVMRDALLQLREAGLDRHTAVTLFRAYAGPAAQYALRAAVVPDSEARRYDLELAQSWSALLGRQVSAAETRFWLPTRMGGVGAMSAVQRAAPSAWAAWSSVLPDLRDYFGADSAEALLDKAPVVQSALAGLHARVVALGAPSWFTQSTLSQAICCPVRAAQLMPHIHTRALKNLTGSMTTKQQAFYRTLRGPGAGGFLEPPLDDRYVISDNRFTIAVCRRLGHPFPQHSTPPTGPLLCTNTTQAGRVCGAQCDPDGSHLECCGAGGGFLVRHDGLVNGICEFAKRGMDARPKVEQVVPQLLAKVCGQVGQARMDVVLHDGAKRMLVDVTVVSPYAGDATFVNACSRRDGHAARRAAIAKRAKYDSVDLVPFAVETGGRLGADARALLHVFAARSDDPARELSYLLRATSSLLQDGVARQLERV